MSGLRLFGLVEELKGLKDSKGDWHRAKECDLLFNPSGKHLKVRREMSVFTEFPRFHRTQSLALKRSRPSRFCDEAERERQWWGDRSLASISVSSVSAKMRSLFAFVFVFIAVLAVSYASPYNKYGRTCKDILCTVREECVMQRDECTGRSDKCGTYPTCKRKPGVGKTGCAAMRCPTGHFCSIRQENCDKPPCQIKPTCIAFRTPSPNRASNVPAFFPAPATPSPTPAEEPPGSEANEPPFTKFRAFLSHF